MKKDNNKELKGFSMVEVVTVVTIISILAAVSVPVMEAYSDKTNDKKLITEGNNYLAIAEKTTRERYTFRSTSAGIESEAEKSKLSQELADAFIECQEKNKELKNYIVKSVDLTDQFRISRMELVPIDTSEGDYKVLVYSRENSGEDDVKSGFSLLRSSAYNSGADRELSRINPDSKETENDELPEIHYSSADKNNISQDEYKDINDFAVTTVATTTTTPVTTVTTTEATTTTPVTTVTTTEATTTVPVTTVTTTEATTTVPVTTVTTTEATTTAPVTTTEAVTLPADSTEKIVTGVSYGEFIDISKYGNPDLLTHISVEFEKASDNSRIDLILFGNDYETQRVTSYQFFDIINSTKFVETSVDQSNFWTKIRYLKIVEYNEYEAASRGKIVNVKLSFLSTDVNISPEITTVPETTPVTTAPATTEPPVTTTTVTTVTAPVTESPELAEVLNVVTEAPKEQSVTSEIKYGELIDISKYGNPRLLENISIKFEKPAPNSQIELILYSDTDEKIYSKNYQFYNGINPGIDLSVSVNQDELMYEPRYLKIVEHNPNFGHGEIMSVNFRFSGDIMVQTKKQHNIDVTSENSTNEGVYYQIKVPNGAKNHTIVVLEFEDYTYNRSGRLVYDNWQSSSFSMNHSSGKVIAVTVTPKSSMSLKIYIDNGEHNLKRVYFNNK